MAQTRTVVLPIRFQTQEDATAVVKFWESWLGGQPGWRVDQGSVYVEFRFDQVRRDEEGADWFPSVPLIQNSIREAAINRCNVVWEDDMWGTVEIIN